MATGPSKQELEMYWKSSRAYFDELAKHYKAADPQYYNEYIQPFYANPFHASSSGKQRSGGGAKLMVVIALFAVLGVGAAAFFIMFAASEKDSPTVKERKTTTESPKEKRSESVEEDNVKGEDNIKGDDNSKDEDGFTPEDHFIIGSKAIADKDYDKAEKHLKRIKPGQKYYKEAKELLENMKYLRQFN
jgi:hypothetical protein